MRKVIAMFAIALAVTGLFGQSAFADLPANPQGYALPFYWVSGTVQPPAGVQPVPAVSGRKVIFYNGQLQDGKKIEAITDQAGNYQVNLFDLHFAYGVDVFADNAVKIQIYQEPDSYGLGETALVVDKAEGITYKNLSLAQGAGSTGGNLAAHLWDGLLLNTSLAGITVSLPALPNKSKVSGADGVALLENILAGSYDLLAHDPTNTYADTNVSGVTVFDNITTSIPVYMFTQPADPTHGNLCVTVIDKSTSLPIGGKAVEVHLANNLVDQGATNINGMKVFDLTADNGYSLVLPSDAKYAEKIVAQVSVAAQATTQIVVALETAPLSFANSLRASQTDDNKVVLDWLPVNGAGGYNVYRGITPYFNADAAALVANNIPGQVSADNRLEWIDATFAPDVSNGINDPSVNYFYLVKSVTNGVESSASNRVGEYTYALLPFNPTNYVWVTNVLNTSYSRNPRLTLSELSGVGKNQIPNLVANYPCRFDDAGQATSYLANAAPKIGEPLFLKVTQAGNYQVTGGVENAVFTITAFSPTFNNWVSIPLNFSGEQTTAALAATMPFAEANYPCRFDVNGQATNFNNNYVPKLGEPIFIKIKSGDFWPK